MILLVGSGVVGRAVACQAECVGRPIVTVSRHISSRLPASARQHAADARSPSIGLASDVAEELRSDVETIIVAVGHWDLSMSLADAYEQLVLPVLSTIEFARSCTQLRSIVFVSSLLAVGEPPARVRSDFIPATSSQHSYYEWAKRETERVLQRSGLPVRIVRAGHVVDDLPEPASNSQLADAIRLLMRFPVVPVSRSARYWTVPATMVADIALAVTENDAPHAVWAVDPSAPSYAELLDMLALRLGVPVRPTPAWRALRVMASRMAADRAALAYYGLAEFDLDLSCLNSLISRGRVAVPSSRHYLVAAVDREITRISDLR